MNERRDSGKEQGARRIARARRKKAKVSNLLLAFIEISMIGKGIIRNRVGRKVQRAKRRARARKKLSKRSVSVSVETLSNKSL